ncbi:MAG: hypothetical protein ACFB8W_00310 [Elainellaceae cyanobacterium]
MSISGNVLNGKYSHSIQLDDLTQIEGIGPVRQQWLRTVFDIHTYGELADLSATAIEAKLRQGQRSLPIQEIEKWLKQARQLASQAGPVEESQPPAAPSLNESGDGWQTEGHFTLTRQTRQDGTTRIVLHCQETGEVRIFEDGQWQTIAQWLNIPLEVEEAAPSFKDVEGAIAAEPEPASASTETSELEHDAGLDEGAQWEGQHRFEAVESTQAASAPEATAKAQTPRPISVQIRQVRLSQALRAAVPLVFSAEQSQRSGAVMGQVPLTVQIGFSLSQREAIAPDLSGHAQIYAMNRSTGDLLNLGEFGDLCLTSIRGGYLVTLPEVRFEEAGIYHLKLLLRLQDCPTIPGYFEIPLLQAI